MHGTCIRPQRSDTAQQTQGYTRHSTNAVAMLVQRRRRWPIIEKLAAPTIFLVFVGYIASGSGYPGGVGDEILLH